MDNATALRELGDTQQQTRASLMRIQQQIAESQRLGHDTLAEMKSQSEQQIRIEQEQTKVGDKLHETNRLLTKFDRWNMDWFGGTKRKSKREARMAVKQQQAEEKTLQSIQDRKNRRENTDMLQITQAASAPNKEELWSTSSPPTSTLSIQSEAPKSSDLWSSPPTSTSSLKAQKEELFKRPATKLKKRPQKQPPGQPMDEKTQNELAQAQAEDADIDNILDSTAASVSALQLLAADLNEETNMQTEHMENVKKASKRATWKQAVVNNRVARTMFRKTGKE